MSTSSGGSNLVDDEASIRFRNVLAARVLEENGGNPLFLSNPEWAARFYLLTVQSDLAQELREELRSQIVDGARLVATARPLRAPVYLVAALQYAVVPHSKHWNGLRPLVTSIG